MGLPTQPTQQVQSQQQPTQSQSQSQLPTQPMISDDIVMTAFLMNTGPLVPNSNNQIVLAPSNQLVPLQQSNNNSNSNSNNNNVNNNAIPLPVNQVSFARSNQPIPLGAANTQSQSNALVAVNNQLVPMGNN